MQVLSFLDCFFSIFCVSANEIFLTATSHCAGFDSIRAAQSLGSSRIHDAVTCTDMQPETCTYNP